MKSRAWAVAVVLTGAFAPDAAADHSYRGRDYAHRRYAYDRYTYDTFRIGLDYGYAEGLREGRRDGERRRGFHFSSDRRFRQGDAGYRRSFGPRFEYVRGFRAGYERGYRAGYDQAVRYSRGRGHSRYGHGWGRWR